MPINGREVRLKLILADVLGTELVRRLVEVARKLGDGSNVGAVRLIREVTESKILDHPLT